MKGRLRVSGQAQAGQAGRGTQDRLLDRPGLIPRDCMEGADCSDYRPGDEKGNQKAKVLSTEPR